MNAETERKRSEEKINTKKEAQRKTGQKGTLQKEQVQKGKELKEKKQKQKGSESKKRSKEKKKKQKEEKLKKQEEKSHEANGSEIKDVIRNTEEIARCFLKCREKYRDCIGGITGLIKWIRDHFKHRSVVNFYRKKLKEKFELESKVRKIKRKADIVDGIGTKLFKTKNSLAVYAGLVGSGWIMGLTAVPAMVVGGLVFGTLALAYYYASRWYRWRLEKAESDLRRLKMEIGTDPSKPLDDKNIMGIWDDAWLHFKKARKLTKSLINAGINEYAVKKYLLLDFLKRYGGFSSREKMKIICDLYKEILGYYKGRVFDAVCEDYVIKAMKEKLKQKGLREEVVSENMLAEKDRKIRIKPKMRGGWL